MRWPWVSREMLEARASDNRSVNSLLTAEILDWKTRYDKLFDEYTRLRVQGHNPIAPKVAPKPADPETAYAAEAERHADNPLVVELMSEGKTLPEALEIFTDALERFRQGEA